MYSEMVGYESENEDFFAQDLWRQGRGGIFR